MVWMFVWRGWRAEDKTDSVLNEHTHTRPHYWTQYKLQLEIIYHMENNVQRVAYWMVFGYCLSIWANQRVYNKSVFLSFFDNGLISSRHRRRGGRFRFILLCNKYLIYICVCSLPVNSRNESIRNHGLKSLSLPPSLPSFVWIFCTTLRCAQFCENVLN